MQNGMKEEIFAVAGASFFYVCVRGQVYAFLFSVYTFFALVIFSTSFFLCVCVLRFCGNSYGLDPPWVYAVPLPTNRFAGKKREDKKIERDQPGLLEVESVRIRVRVTIKKKIIWKFIPFKFPAKNRGKYSDCRLSSFCLSVWEVFGVVLWNLLQSKNVFWLNTCWREAESKNI